MFIKSVDNEQTFWYILLANKCSKGRKERNAMRRNHRKYRIKSPFRFVTFLVIVAGLIVGVFGYVTGFDVSTALAKPSDQITVKVVSGDTLWDIAYEFKSSDKDVRKAVYEICQANNIEDGHIEDGMILEIPQSL